MLIFHDLGIRFRVLVFLDVFTIAKNAKLSSNKVVPFPFGEFEYSPFPIIHPVCPPKFSEELFSISSGYYSRLGRN